MARFALACVIALAFLMNGAVASAASASCDMSIQGAMASMQHHNVANAAGDPCCEHAGKKACADACATVCATLAAIPSPDVTVTAFPVRVSVAPAETPSLISSEPRGLERPPKSIA